MKIFRWNVRGTGRRGFKYQLKDLVITYKLNVIILTKTKANRILLKFHQRDFQDVYGYY